MGSEGKEKVGNEVDRAVAMGVAIGKAGLVVLKVILPKHYGATCVQRGYVESNCLKFACWKSDGEFYCLSNSGVSSPVKKFQRNKGYCSRGKGVFMNKTGFNKTIRGATIK